MEWTKITDILISGTLTYELVCSDALPDNEHAVSVLLFCSSDHVLVYCSNNFVEIWPAIPGKQPSSLFQPILFEIKIGAVPITKHWLLISSLNYSQLQALESLDSILINWTTLKNILPTFNVKTVVESRISLGIHFNSEHDQAYFSSESFRNTFYHRCLNV